MFWLTEKKERCIIIVQTTPPHGLLPPRARPRYLASCANRGCRPLRGCRNSQRAGRPPRSRQEGKPLVLPLLPPPLPPSPPPSPSPFRAQREPRCGGGGRRSTRSTKFSRPSGWKGGGSGKGGGRGGRREGGEGGRRVQGEGTSITSLYNKKRLVERCCRIKERGLCGTSVVRIVGNEEFVRARG